MSGLATREYGSGPLTLITVHGGPAAAGDLGPLARTLGNRWHVLEPFQRGSSRRPLTVAGHVQDLYDLVATRCGDRRPVLIGHSWGAMLALACAAAHPVSFAALVLIGCGTFSATARAELERRTQARLRPEDRNAMSRVGETEPDLDRRLAALGRLMTRVYACDLDAAAADEVVVTADARAHEESWADMLRLQRAGVYPEAFRSIRCPVLMLHGDCDPHPGPATRDDLRAYIPHLEYRELARCGHSPWLERQACDEFHRVLAEWLNERAAPGGTAR